MSALSLPQKVAAIHQTLGVVPHAYGGAIALAYYAEPRATIDIDLNLFVQADRSAPVVEVLTDLGVVMPDGHDAIIREAGQIRANFGRTPLDLFFSYDPFHEAAARARRTVPFADVEIPVLSASHLVVCKAVFARPKDWVDIDAMVEQQSPIDLAEVMRWVGRIVGDTDIRYRRIGRVLSR